MFLYKGCEALGFSIHDKQHIDMFTRVIRPMIIICSTADITY